jgi:hypothetical protein
VKPTFTITIARKRDVLLAQLRARQLCRMLGFPLSDQARVVGLVFEIGSRLLRRGCRPLISFQVEDHVFRVTSRPDPPHGLHRSPLVQAILTLPLPQPFLAVEDVFWAMQQIDSLSKPDLFGELRQQNNDLLRALAELQHFSSVVVPKTVRASAA